MTIKSFDKATFKVLRPEIDKALAAVGEKYGISLKMGNVSYSSFEFRTKVEAKIIGAEVAKPAFISNPFDYSEMLGYPAIGTEFKMQGKNFKVVSHEPQRPKYPIVAEDMRTGKKYKFTLETIKASLTAGTKQID